MTSLVPSVFAIAYLPHVLTGSIKNRRKRKRETERERAILSARELAYTKRQTKRGSEQISQFQYRGFVCRQPRCIGLMYLFQFMSVVLVEFFVMPIIFHTSVCEDEELCADGMPNGLNYVTLQCNFSLPR